MKSHVIAVGVVKYKNQYLTMKRSPNKKYAPNEWEFCGGGLQEKESAEDAVIREVREETGLTGEIVKTGKVHESIEGGDRLIAIPFMITVDSDVVKISEEHTEFEWCTEEKAAAKDEWMEDILGGF